MIYNATAGLCGVYDKKIVDVKRREITERSPKLVGQLHKIKGESRKQLHRIKRDGGDVYLSTKSLCELYVLIMIYSKLQGKRKMKRERFKETLRDNPLPRRKTLVLLLANNNIRVGNNNSSNRSLNRANRLVDKMETTRRRTRRERIRAKTSTAQ